MTRDLDAADLGEVRRRAVDPVLLAALRPGEQHSVELTFGPTSSWAGRPSSLDREPEVWLTLVVCGETFGSRLEKVIYQRCDAHEVALRLADQLEDWLPETRFAWGQRRVVDIGHAVPGAATQVSTGIECVIEVYPNEDASSLLWVQGKNISADQLGLSAMLVEQLARWRARWRELVDDPAGVTWVSIVSELEPDRRRLVAALRQEVPTRTAVAEPIPLDEVTRSWLTAQWPAAR